MCDRLRNFDSWPNDFGFSDGVKGCELSNIEFLFKNIKQANNFSFNIPQPP